MLVSGRVVRHILKRVWCISRRFLPSTVATYLNDSWLWFSNSNLEPVLRKHQTSFTHFFQVHAFNTTCIRCKHIISVIILHTLHETNISPIKKITFESMIFRTSRFLVGYGLYPFPKRCRWTSTWKTLEFSLNAKPRSGISSSFHRKKKKTGFDLHKLCTFIWYTIYIIWIIFNYMSKNISIHIKVNQIMSNYVKLADFTNLIWKAILIKYVCLPSTTWIKITHPFKSLFPHNKENATTKNRTWPASACVQDSLGHLPICLGRIKKSIRPKSYSICLLLMFSTWRHWNTVFLSICCCPVLFSVARNSFQKIVRVVGPSCWEWAISEILYTCHLSTYNWETKPRNKKTHVSFTWIVSIWLDQTIHFDPPEVDLG